MIEIVILGFVLLLLLMLLKFILGSIVRMLLNLVFLVAFAFILRFTWNEVLIEAVNISTTLSFVQSLIGVLALRIVFGLFGD